MLVSALKSLVLVGSAVGSVALGAAVDHAHSRRGGNPTMPYDQNTTPHCTWWIDVASATTCDQVLSENFISMVEFRRWNPVIGDRCFVTVGRSYCVEAFNEPPPATTSSTSSTQRPTTTSAPTTSSTSTRTSTTTSSTTTKPGNGIATPTPVQPNIVDNCDKFYLVRPGDTCDSVASNHGILTSMLRAWNPNVGSTCGGLQRDAYACVSIIGVGTRPASDFPEKVLDKTRAAERTISLMGPDIQNWFLRAASQWPRGSEAQDAANTAAYFWPTTNNQLTVATSKYVNGLLSGSRPTIPNSRKREESWGQWSHTSDNETIEAAAAEYWRRSEEGTKKLVARDLYDDMLDMTKAALRTWSIMGPDVHNMANEAAAWWSGSPQTLSRTFSSEWKKGSDEQNILLQWFISTIERTGRP